MSRFAISTPYLIVVICVIVALLGGVAITRMPVDMFPPINIPVVVVATFYSGMPPEQIENGITFRLERFFTLGSGVEHIESRSLTGVSIIKIFFQPGTNADAAVAMMGGLATAEMSRMPPGTMPPVVLKFDASSLPVCLLTLGGEGLSETQLKDIAQNVIRNQLAGVPGASVPQPFGGRGRQMMLYADPYKLEAHQLSLMDVVRTIGESNVIMPAGDVQLGRFDYSIYTNSMLNGVADINQTPLKMVGQSPVRVSDIGEAKDAQTLQYNIVRVNGQRSVYLPILKQGGDSNTIAVVDGIRAKVRKLVDIPDALKTAVVFDNPVVSVAPILAVPGIREAVVAAPGRVAGVSPIIGGAPVRGMADRCLAVIGVECSAAGVGGLYGARVEGGLLDTWLVDSTDAGAVVPGVDVRAVALRMVDEAATAAMVAAAVEAA